MYCLFSKTFFKFYFAEGGGGGCRDGQGWERGGGVGVGGGRTKSS